MAIARGFAAIAMLSGLAVGLAAPAPAVVQLTGHYTETETAPDGHQFPPNDWYFTPCGDGCASVALSSGGPVWGQAQLVNGQWTMNVTTGVSCEQGGDVPNAITDQFTWDPNTLAGTSQITNNVQACGNPAGYQETNNLQLASAP